MNALLLRRQSRRWLGVAGCLMLCLGPGCSGSNQSGSGSQNVSGWQSRDIEATLKALPARARAEIDALTLKVDPPASVPAGIVGDARQAYVQWYQKGYAFAFITGTEYLRDQVAKQQEEVEKAKERGWVDGTRAGSSAKRKAEMDSKFGGIMTNR